MNPDILKQCENAHSLHASQAEHHLEENNLCLSLQLFPNLTSMIEQCPEGKTWASLKDEKGYKPIYSYSVDLANSLL